MYIEDKSATVDQYKQDYWSARVNEMASLITTKLSASYSYITVLTNDDVCILCACVCMYYTGTNVS